MRLTLHLTLQPRERKREREISSPLHRSFLHPSPLPSVFLRLSSSYSTPELLLFVFSLSLSLFCFLLSSLSFSSPAFILLLRLSYRSSFLPSLFLLPPPTSSSTSPFFHPPTHISTFLFPPPTFHFSPPTSPTTFYLHFPRLSYSLLLSSFFHLPSSILPAFVVVVVKVDPSCFFFQEVSHQLNGWRGMTSVGEGKGGEGEGS